MQWLHRSAVPGYSKFGNLQNCWKPVQTGGAPVRLLIACPNKYMTNILEGDDLIANFPILNAILVCNSFLIAFLIPCCSMSCILYTII